MRLSLLLILMSAAVFGQQMAPKDEMPNPERKRFTKTCDALASQLMQPGDIAYNNFFCKNLSKESKNDIATFQKELVALTNKGIEYTVSKSNSNENDIFTITFEIGKDHNKQKKLFLLFEPGDTLVDDVMIISQGTETVLVEDNYNDYVTPLPPLQVTDAN